MARFAAKKIKQRSRSDLGLVDGYRYGHHDEIEYQLRLPKGLSRQVVRTISWDKNEPKWMRQQRQVGLNLFGKLKLPSWLPNLNGLDFNNIYYYLKPTVKVEHSWDEVPEKIRRTFERLGVPQAEREFLAGVKSQYDSQVVYGSLKKELTALGVVFLGMDEALVEYPELVRQYFGSVVPVADNKLAALNTAVWSGGSFIYIPPGVKVDRPLQAYFRINSARAGQFERTLIIADEGSEVSYVEGCSAPSFTESSLHSAVVEIVVKKGAKVRYTTIQNWYKNVYNLVTKRARVEEEGRMEWVDGNLGSRMTTKYPACLLVGRKAYGEILSIAVAGRGQHQDVGGKIIHLATETSSQIISKSISYGGGRTSYRGLLNVGRSAKNSRSKVVCDALILDSESRSDTYPTIRVETKDAEVEHEATVSKIGEDQLFYLMSRGLTEEQANAVVVNGFLEEVIREIPIEYAAELNRLIELEMEGAVG